MEDELEHSNTRIQLICDTIRKETVEPAKLHAQAIIEQAKKEAEQIRQHAKEEQKRLHEETKKQLERERQIFQSTLQQAAKQTIEVLKQKIETSLFEPQIHEWVLAELGKEQSHAQLVEVIVEAIQKEGIQTVLSAKVPERFSADAINASLSKKILDQLENHSVTLAGISGGVQVKIEDKHLTIDVSAKTLEEIIFSFVHKGFRKAFFGV